MLIIYIRSASSGKTALWRLHGGIINATLRVVTSEQIIAKLNRYSYSFHHYNFIRNDNVHSYTYDIMIYIIPIVKLNDHSYCKIEC